VDVNVSVEATPNGVVRAFAASDHRSMPRCVMLAVGFVPATAASSAIFLAAAVRGIRERRGAG
jgi:hypothetical protein